VIFLNRPGEDDFKKIIEIQLNRPSKRHVHQRITLKLSDSAKEPPARQGYDTVYGARP
jgi:ATP-dependent Clp protease ATP-binding subunit ClpA